MPRLAAPRFEGTLHLRDGRGLGFAEFGPVSGRPVLWFHGTPGARRQIPPEARRLAGEKGVRIISVERPGVGQSTPHLYRVVAEFAEDIEQLSAALGLERFGLVGLSGGGPYALACAHRMPQRVVNVTVLGGVAPAVGRDAAEGGASALLRVFSPLLRVTHAPLGGMTRRLIQLLEPLADPVVDLVAGVFPPGDQLVFADPENREMFVEDLLLGSRRHMQGLWLDTTLFGRDWGFALGEVRVPVHLYYGDSDAIVPVAHGRHLAERIPGAVLQVRPGEGHLGGIGASREIFEAILADWTPTAGG